MLYDTLIVLGGLAVLGLMSIPITGKKLLVSAETGALTYAFRGLQLLLIVLFFGYFWSRRGQTIGMLAWRLQITSSDGGAVRWTQSLRRLATLIVLLLPYLIGDWLWFSHWPDRAWRTVAWCVCWTPLVVCYAWIWIDRQHQAWHDRLSDTRIWLLPKISRAAL
jgi:uncharacterized RDD family membrane protein YckC